MRRGPRLDAPGTLHHVMVRGIERTAFFRDRRGRTDFLARLAAQVTRRAGPVYAWALLPNHAHLVGPAPTALTGGAWRRPIPAARALLRPGPHRARPARHRGGPSPRGVRLPGAAAEFRGQAVAAARRGEVTEMVRAVLGRGR